MQGSELEAIIKAGIQDAEVLVKGEGDHFEATVVSRQFEGRSMVQQHQMVYDALQGNMGGTLHALALKTAAP